MADSWEAFSKHIRWGKAQLHSFASSETRTLTFGEHMNVHMLSHSS